MNYEYLWGYKYNSFEIECARRFEFGGCGMMKSGEYDETLVGEGTTIVGISEVEE